MTDALEKIWVWVDSLNGLNVSGTLRKPSTYFENYYAEYVRADLVPGWSSDMDAAPKDGTLHLRGLWVHSAKTGKPLYWQVDAGGYDDGEFTGPHGDDFGWSADDYTHWMPLPSPPKGETK